MRKWTRYFCFFGRMVIVPESQCLIPGSGSVCHKLKMVPTNVRGTWWIPHCGLYAGSTHSQSPQGDGSHQGWVSSLLKSWKLWTAFDNNINDSRVISSLLTLIFYCGMYVPLCDDNGVMEQIWRGWSLFHIPGVNPCKLCPLWRRQYQYQPDSVMTSQLRATLLLHTAVVCNHFI